MQATPLVAPIRASLTAAVTTMLQVLPRLLGFAVVLVAGWLASSLLARATIALLRAVRFNDLARRSGFAEFVSNMGVRQDAAGVIASIVKWAVRLIALVMAFDLLGLRAVSTVLEQLLLWLPNLVVALVVLVVGGLAANALSRLVRGTTAGAGFSNPDMLAAVTRIAVWSFAVVVAVSQLGIATALLDTLVAGVVGALALATGLAFGLGGRDRAARLLDQLDRRPERPGPRLERPAPTAASAPSTPEISAPLVQPRTPAFEESWIPRTGTDRRRVPRAGPDRRALA